MNTHMSTMSIGRPAAHRRRTTAACLLVMLLSTSLQAQTAAGPADWLEPASVMRGCIERYGTDYDAIDRSYGMPISPARNERMRKLYNDNLALLAGLTFESMSQEDRVDYIMFKNYLSHELRQLAIDSTKYAEEKPLIPFAGTISGLEDARLKFQWADGAATAALAASPAATARAVATRLTTMNPPGVMACARR